MTHTTLKTQIQEAIKTAMRAKDAEKLGTLRLVSAAIKQLEVDTRTEPDNAQIIALLSKMIKQRQESISHYVQGQRPDLAAKEEAEIAILHAYMPEALSNEAIDAAIEATFQAIQPQSPQEMGKVMQRLKLELAGRADLSEVSKRVKARMAF
jgi:uncharacterized protein